MKLTVVGCSGTMPGADGPASSYLFESAGFRLLVDCGNGASGALQRYVGLLDLDAVLISHVHADHCLDLVVYSYARRYAPAARRPLPVYGPEGSQERLLTAFDAAPARPARRTSTSSARCTRAGAPSARSRSTWR